MKTILLALILPAIVSGAQSPPAYIVLRETELQPLIIFAGREVQRYTYLRTGTILPIADAAPADRPAIDLAVDPALPAEGFRLQSVDQRLRITGGSATAVLYGAYGYAELLGVRFSLHGDVIPDEAIPFALPAVDKEHTPLFAHRGIQPFHDFTEGPDWWSMDDYKCTLGQLAKLRMNWIGFHCYPEGGVGPEPLVWIGLPEDVNDDGTVKWAYPSRWASTSSGGSWGYGTTKTSAFAAGAGLLFAGDDFGAPVTDGLRPLPETPTDCAELFNRTGRFLDEAFTFAGRFGIHTAVGTETPLTIPKALQDRLRDKGLDPAAPGTVRKLYEGMFLRIARAHPLGTYWLWTPESWTWRANTQEQLDTTVRDFEAATGALNVTGQPFGFAACGWVLGPSSDRSLFDRALPAQAALACINRQVGFTPVESGFARVENRPQWAIPWVEDDPAMILPQLWVGRLRRDAADAHAYGCTGLMGIHWRTRILAPNFAALAAAAWNQQGWNPEPGVRIQPAEGPATDCHTGGQTAAYPNPISETDEDAVYQSCRYNVDGYKVRVPNGAYTVTLKFCEVHYDQPGKRVFGVTVMGRKVATGMDVFAKAGKNTAHDLVVPKVKVEDEVLEIDFTRETEFPFIAGIVIEGTTAGANQIEGKRFVRRINCGGGAGDGYEADLPASQGDATARKLPRDLPAADFYRDWCRAEFGPEVATELATLFARLDGGPDNYGRNNAHLPRPAEWIAGPGGITVNATPWEQERKRYAFVEEMAALQDRVCGPGNRARFDYWLCNFRYLRAVGQLGCTRGALDAAMKNVAVPEGPEEKRQRAQAALALREQLARDWERMMTHQLAATETIGALGTIANLEQHVRRNPRSNGQHRFLDVHDTALAEALGEDLPDTVQPTTRYLGDPRLIVPTVRPSRDSGEALDIPVMLLDEKPPASIALHWRRIGQAEWQTAKLRHLGRAVWHATLPATGNETVEYRITAETAGATKLAWPAGLPQTVVAIPTQ